MSKAPAITPKKMINLAELGAGGMISSTVSLTWNSAAGAVARMNGMMNGGGWRSESRLRYKPASVPK
jgi:hypothetical protein